jgi:16S rRNA (guanine966-N2)-methyltransferase
MRITGGAAKNILLQSSKQAQLRPATDQMREAVFSYLQTYVTGTFFLDLFAGTGAYGLEALSRGAVGGVFIESHASTKVCLKSNLAAVCKSAQLTETICKIYQTDVFKWKPKPDQLFDLVFIDPPYALFQQTRQRLLYTLINLLKLKQSGHLLIELPGEIPTPALEHYTCIRRLGKNAPRHPNVCIYQAS